MKYFLVQSTIDYGDEFDVNSLNCLTEQEYLDLLDRPLGDINEYYQDELLAWNDYQQDIIKYSNLFKEKYNNVHYTQYTEEDRLWIRNNQPISPKHPVKYLCYHIYSKLGNFGDEFEKVFNSYDNMLDLIDAGLVKVHVVDESFYNTFHKANLKKLSLTNIFER